MIDYELEGLRLLEKVYERKVEFYSVLTGTQAGATYERRLAEVRDLMRAKGVRIPTDGRS